MNEPRRLRLELAPSPSLAIAMVALHGVAAACAVLLIPGAAGLALGAALVALGLAAAWARALLRSSLSVRALELQGPESVLLELANGESLSAQVSRRRHVGRFAVTLPVLRPVRRTILVSRDMLGGDSFRLLRIWALWGKLPGAATEQLPA